MSVFAVLIRAAVLAGAVFYILAASNLITMLAEVHP